MSAFLGEPDDALRARLASGRAIKIKKGTGGRSLAFKLTLDNGAEGYFKPEQSFSGTIWFAELVAYYLDRALGMGRVPVVVGRQLSWSKLAAAAGDDERTSEVTVSKDGHVRGALIAWLPKPPQPAHTPPGWENWIRIEPFSQFGITPFQRASEHGVALREFRERAASGADGIKYYEETPKPERADLPGALSDLLVLDFLTLNLDRWGGHNGNVLTLGAGGPLVFLDNAAGFSRGPHRRSLMDGRFFPCQRFRKHTIEALQRFDRARFAAVLAADPLAPLLDDSLLDGLLLRRDAVLEHVGALRARFGDAAVMPW